MLDSEDIEECKKASWSILLHEAFFVSDIELIIFYIVQNIGTFVNLSTLKVK